VGEVSSHTAKHTRDVSVVECRMILESTVVLLSVSVTENGEVAGQVVTGLLHRV
jgi:hypothetical protein